MVTAKQKPMVNLALNPVLEEMTGQCLLMEKVFLKALTEKIKIIWTVL